MTLSAVFFVKLGDRP